MTSEHPRVVVWFVPAGFPCQDLSSLNKVARAGLGGSRSGLYLEVLRVVRDGQAHCAGFADVLLLGENVASADANELATVTKDFGVRAVEVDGGDLTHCRRPRVFWPDWDFDEEDDVEWHFARGRWIAKLKLDGLPPCTRWLDRGAKFDRGESGGRLPTLTRAVEKLRPPRDPAGINRLRPHEIERWRADRFAQPAYQYADSNCITGADGVLRQPSSTEREQLMGFPKDHTIPAVPSAQLSSNKRATEYVRKALVGNSFCCQVVAWLIGHCLARRGLLQRRPTLQELAQGVPLALGAGASAEAQVVPKESSAEKDELLRQEQPGRALARRLAGLSDFRGSDVRLSLDAPMKPGGWPRAETPANFWKWRTAFAVKWRAEAKEHINILELRAALASLRWRTRQRRFLRRRLIHLLDSAVVIGVLTKRRSANPILRFLVRRCNALELASGSHCMYAFTRSTHNPADKPSRSFRPGRPQKFPVKKLGKTGFRPHGQAR